MLPLKDFNPTRRRAWITLGLIVACVLVYFWVQPPASGVDRGACVGHELEQLADVCLDVGVGQGTERPWRRNPRQRWWYRLGRCGFWARIRGPGRIMDIELTPRWKAILNATYLQFADTEVIQRVLFDDRIDREIGMDYSIGIQYRPFLNNNFIVTVGGAALVPGKGFADIYSGEVFYSGFVGLTLTY